MVIKVVTKILCNLNLASGSEQQIELKNDQLIKNFFYCFLLKMLTIFLLPFQQLAF